MSNAHTAPAARAVAPSFEERAVSRHIACARLAYGVTREQQNALIAQRVTAGIADGTGAEVLVVTTVTAFRTQDAPVIAAALADFPGATVTTEGRTVTVTRTR